MTYDLIAKGNLVLPTSDPTRRLTGLVAAALILGACADGVDEPTGPSDQDAFELPVHLHVVQSDHVGALNALLTDPEVGKLMVAVNQTWSQAGITWILESIVRERARNESVFREALMNRALSPIVALPSVLSHDDARPDVWNVFMIRDFGGTVGGAYLPMEHVVVSSEVDPLGQRDVRGGMARVLAHELGHSLGLADVACTEEGNLMAADCLQGSRTYLDPSQVTRARLQADFGRPF